MWWLGPVTVKVMRSGQFGGCNLKAEARGLATALDVGVITRHDLKMISILLASAMR